MPSLSTLLADEPAYRPLRAVRGTITLYPTRFELHQAALYIARKAGELSSRRLSPPYGTGRATAFLGSKLSPSEEFDHSSDMVSFLIFLNSAGLGASRRDPLLLRETIDALVGRRPHQSWWAREPITFGIETFGNHIWGEGGGQQDKSASRPFTSRRGQRQQLLRRRKACHRLWKGFNLSVRRECNDREGTQCHNLPDAQARSIDLTPAKGGDGEMLILWLAQGDETDVRLRSLPSPYPELGLWGVLEQIGRDIGHSLERARFQQRVRPSDAPGTKRVREFRRSTCILQREWLARAAAKAPWADQALSALLEARKAGGDREIVVCLQRRGSTLKDADVEAAVQTELRTVFGCRQRRTERDAKLVFYLDAEGKPVRFSEFRRYVDPKGHLDPHDWSLGTW